MGRTLTTETEKCLPLNLEETITIDCKDWMRRKNGGAMFESTLYLNECSNSKESGLYQLILNGMELTYGTLEEINAVVKSMLRLIDR